jgi:hypothetical protein
VTELPDSVEGGTVEWRYGLAGDARRSHVREALEVQTDSITGSFRGGDDEPLAGGGVTARGNGREVRVGRMSPRWSLGLLLGAPGEPWSHADSGPELSVVKSGPSGEGVAWSPHATGIEVLGGRFGKRSLAALGWGRSSLHAGVLAGRRGEAQGSVGIVTPLAAAEVAFDRGGAWRAEGQATRAFAGARLTMRARGGRESFRSLAEPKRAGPPKAVGVLLTSGRGAVTTIAGLSAWRFTPGVSGTRASLVFEHRDDAATWRLGWEEQHGPRRISATSGKGMRQGVWIECHAGAPPLSLALRQELWGRAPFARRAVRRSIEAGVEARFPGGIELRAAHAVLDARPGETIYLPELESDRLVLRAVSGPARRTRLVARVPAADGALSAGVGLGLARSGTRRSDWSVQWSRRLKLRGRR